MVENLFSLVIHGLKFRLNFIVFLFVVFFKEIHIQELMRSEQVERTSEEAQIGIHELIGVADLILKEV